MITPSTFKRGDQVRLTRDMPTYHTRPGIGRPGVPKGTHGIILAIYESETEDPLHLLQCEFETDTETVITVAADMTLQYRPGVQASATLDATPFKTVPFATLNLRSSHRIQNTIEQQGIQLGRRNLWIVTSIDTACQKMLKGRLPTELDSDEQEALKVFEKMQSDGFEQAMFVFGDR